MATPDIAIAERELRSCNERMTEMEKHSAARVLARIQQGLTPTEDELQILSKYVEGLEQYHSLRERADRTSRNRTTSRRFSRAATR
jgi:hypothetical protein